MTQPDRNPHSETFVLSAGIVTVEAPAGTTIREENPRQTAVVWPDGMEVHVIVDAIRGPDEMFAPEVAAEHTVGQLGVAVDPAGNFYADVQTGHTPPDADGRAGKVFIRFDRFRDDILRTATFAPGEREGETDQDLARTDAAAEALAAGARFSDLPTPFDRLAPDPGEGLVILGDCLLFNLPPEWTAHPDYEENVEAPEEGKPSFRAEMNCHSPDKRFQLNAYVAVVPRASMAPEMRDYDATDNVIGVCQAIVEEEEGLLRDIAVQEYPSEVRASGLVSTDPHTTKGQRLIRTHVLVGSDWVVFGKFDLRGPKRRGRADDRAHLDEIDDRLADAQPWHPDLATVLAEARREEEEGEDEIGLAERSARPREAEEWVDLGQGMVRLPVAADWTWRATSPLDGSLTVEDGQRIDLSVRSYFAPEAVGEPGGLARLVVEDDYELQVTSDEDLLANVVVMAPMVDDADAPPDKPIVVKSLERQGDANVRVLRVEAPVVTAGELESLVFKGMEIALRADWAAGETPFERIGPSKEAQLVTVGGWLWFQVPADWTLIPNNADRASVDDPDGLETLWIEGSLTTGRGGATARPEIEAMMREKLSVAVPGDLRETGREWLGEHDLMATIEGAAEDATGPLRRYRHHRIFAVDDRVACLIFSHVVDRDTQDDRRDWTRAFIREALATAVVAPEFR